MLTLRTCKNEAREDFNRLEDEHHEMGKTHSGGDTMRLIIEEDGRKVALMVWGSASYRLKERDAYVGWTASLRAARQKLVVANRRFTLLVPPGSRPNLASQVLGLAARELPGQGQPRSRPKGRPAVARRGGSHGKGKNIDSSNGGHGRLECRVTRVGGVDGAPVTIGLPHVRTLVRVDRNRQGKNATAAPEEPETAFYIALRDAGERTPGDWAQLVRRHWGVENPNHWRRAATLLEDLKTYRGKQRNICAAFLLGRTALLVFNADWGDGNLNALQEELRASPTAVWSLVSTGVGLNEIVGIFGNWRLSLP